MKNIEICFGGRSRTYEVWLMRPDGMTDSHRDIEGKVTHS